MDNTVHELVQLAVTLFQQHQDAEDEYISELLDQSGIDETQIEDLVTFVPMGFCHAWSDSIGVAFPTNYTLLNPITSESASFPLADQPFFQEAYRVGGHWAANNLDGDLFFAVAGRSAEFDAINQALKAGARPSAIIAGETVISDKNWRPAIAKQPWWRLRRKR